jgi:hypothetical protein
MNAEEAIRRTLAEFGRYLDERRFVEMSDLFCEDGSFGATAGRAQILAEFLGGPLAKEPDLFRKHATVNSTIAVDGTSAAVASDLLLFERRGQGPWGMRFGIYEDVFREVGDRWLIEHRQLLWTANPIHDGNPILGV